jgi:hypothetical protein
MTNHKMKKFALAIIFAFCMINFSFAKENIGDNSGSGLNPHRDGVALGPNQVAAANCAPSKSHKDLDINNIRCPIWINGDMWWDLVGNARYEIPKDSRKYSLFAGGLWIGGKDVSGNLKVAAQTYRQSGSDFWPGPIDTTGGQTTTNSSECLKYDRHWKVTREEVEALRNSHLAGHTPITPSIDIREWPGNGVGQELGAFNYLAPFHDEFGDGIYEVENGDYPGYNLNTDQNNPDSASASHEYLLGDQTLWWVFNDVGNIHGETHGAAIGLEIQAQAFAFKTNDEINNMSFYKYKIINRSTLQVDSNYFGAWVDPDLGNYLDDYVGCDVKRGFGYCYNGDAYDDGITGYGFNPPAIGYDFFQGPHADIGDGVDNDRDGCIDCTFGVDSLGHLDTIPDTVQPELIIMSKFVYYNNDFSVIGNPVSAADYYNYLKGIWKDGTGIKYGGNGHGANTGATNIPCNFMFPGCSDPTGWGTNHVPMAQWDEVTAGNNPDDRRFLQTAGPFTLMPGAVNYIITGAVWAKAGSGGPGQACSSAGSLALVLLADDKAQKLFDHNFAITNGPDAADLAIRELDQELLFAISNPKGSNNNPLDSTDESYHEIDPNLNQGDSIPEYHFEGYQVFQLKDASVTTNDLRNPDKASLVFQCDIKNGVGQIVNYFKDPNTTAFYGVEEVNGDDKGLRHVFRLTKDKFATGDDRLINHKTYYYTIISYGYNPIENAKFNYNNTLDGDGKPYISGRRRITTYTAIPHKIAPEANGLVLNSSFGDGPEITRIEGKGNGYIIGSDRKALDLTSSTVDEIIFNTTHRSLHPVYQRAKGPVDIRVYDPVKVKGGTFELWADDTTYSASWHLKNLTTGDVFNSVSTIGVPYDQFIFENGNGDIFDYGFYINMTQLVDKTDTSEALIFPGSVVGKNNIPQFIEATLSFENSTQRWLGGVADQDASPFNWIGSGNSTTPGMSDYTYGLTGSGDAENVWGKLIGGTWTAYKFASYDSASGHSSPVTMDPNPPGLIHKSFNQFKDQASVDIVFTSDTRYWSKCIVIEQSNQSSASIGNALMGTPRRSTSLKLDGGTLVPDTGTGFSYFPGYAIDVETGERLNIAFGEDSRLVNHHGADMMWNPTSTFFDEDGSVIFGGKHVVYVFAHNSEFPLYDGCSTLYSRLNSATSFSSAANYRRPWGSCMWVGYPMLNRGETLLSTKATVRIRVAKPYEAYQTDVPPSNNNFPKYRFNTDDLVPVTGDLATAKSALDLINVVPNPYYAYSVYEKNQLDNRIKIINLPSKCVVSIYTPNGIMVRQLRRDVNSDNTSGEVYSSTKPNLETALEWDLKNTAGVPVASGIYLIHIEVPGVGEKTIKWFGVLRPIDLDTF